VTTDRTFGRHCQTFGLQTLEVETTDRQEKTLCNTAETLGGSAQRHCRQDETLRRSVETHRRKDERQDLEVVTTVRSIKRLAL
jgi:hypothetical protein